MKLLISLLIFCNMLFAHSINESLLNIHATIVPKLPLMDYKFQKKLKDNAILIVIYYDSIDYKSAKKLQYIINEKYKNGIKEYPIKTKLSLYNKKQGLKANIYYLFPSTNKNIKHTIQNAKINSAITFSYLQDDLANGCMISLDIGAKVKPIINLNAIKQNNISLRPVLLKISNIYVDTEIKPDLSLKYKNTYIVQL